jgi:cytochrome c2
MSAVSKPGRQHAQICRRLAAITLAIAGAANHIGIAHAEDGSPAAFGKCLACHAVGAAAANKNGPVLNGVAGKPAGAAEGFVYSEAFQEAKATGLVWTSENLDKYLADPIGFMPGSRMAWAVPDASERAAIVTYLMTLP